MGEKNKMKNAKKDNWDYKDWELHARVVNLLQQKRKTITEMAGDIGEHKEHISMCIWGIPGRNIRRIEDRIAAYLGVSREDLFGKEEAAQRSGSHARVAG
jgi:hypothetical protein